MELLLTEENGKKRSLITDENSERKRRKQEHSNYGDGMAWFRGSLIGKGCFGSVFLANLKKPKSRYSSYPPIMAVKSAEVSVSSSIQKEREVLNNIRGCRNVIRCFGEEITTGENGQMVYNLLLEYGSGGTLADLIKKSDGNGLPEFDARRHTRSILRGLRHIHHCGYVHCDLKPENILLVASSVDGGFTAKIGDLGLAKRAKQSKKSKSVSYWRGTPMYFSPEVVIDGVQEPPSDIWTIGCVLLEMLTGKPPWDSKPETNGDEILSRIGENNESPSIPTTISREARSFLKGCFSRKAMYRWTAEMLLAHPFLEGIGDDEDDDHKVEEPEVLDINAISSSMMSESEDDDEISFSSFSDGSEEELYFWSEEDADGMENEISSCFSVEESLKADRSTTAPLNEVHQYPISFTISSGV
ncbi:mitogen-activated protein kinase kinase kinase 17-like [Cynara cardunculus var. scolymus]|uniref:mitogen-activated protein kinase kinase kinase 17-like n=1 Tax=Cynara cardunculus var. scolymus TaxID=59895 RepID=UPI000D6290AC|nr:mitogen-activated protein kinase kinase kinase 17-like [Cynara cardunculus var. scolymus]